MRREKKEQTSKKTQARCRAVSTPFCKRKPSILTLLSRPSLSLSKRRKMAVAAASTGTADAAAKGLSETKAIEPSRVRIENTQEGPTFRLGVGGLKKCKRVESAQARFEVPLALVGVLERAPERRQNEGRGKGRCEK